MTKCLNNMKKNTLTRKNKVTSSSGFLSQPKDFSFERIIIQNKICVYHVLTQYIVKPFNRRAFTLKD